MAINVIDNYKLINLTVDDIPKTVKINTSDAWNVMEYELNGETAIIHEGDKIEFIAESGERKLGIVNKLSGKGNNTKIQINPIGSSYEEIWVMSSIVDDTLKVVNEEDEDEEVEEE